MRMHEVVRVVEGGFARLRRAVGEAVAGRSFDPPGGSVVEVEGWVRALLRERGKIVPGSVRDGKNIWTNVGREYLALLISYEDIATHHRDDRVAYVGVGVGSQTEDANVVKLVTPTAYFGTEFLAPLDLSFGVSPSFPLTPSRTTVEFHRVFKEDEITLTPASTVAVSEIGLFTNGNQSTFAEGGRDTSMTGSALQSPVAYRTFEPLTKTDSLELEVSWQIRF